MVLYVKRTSCRDESFLIHDSATDTTIYNEVDRGTGFKSFLVDGKRTSDGQNRDILFHEQTSNSICVIIF